MDYTVLCCCFVFCCAENNNYFIKFPPDKITKGYFIVFDILPKLRDARAKIDKNDFQPKYQIYDCVNDHNGAVTCKMHTVVAFNFVQLYGLTLIT